MTELHAVSLERHESRNWRKPADFLYAAGDALTVVGTQEMISAVPHAALGFASLDNSYITVFVQGLEAGRNLLVSPEGRWLCGMVPMYYQHYPFKLARNEGAEWLVCVDEASGLVGEPGSGEAFFGEDKKSSPALSEITEKLAQHERDKDHNKKACAVLQKYNLFEPWAMTIQSPDGEQSQEITGLFRIDEKALNELPADVLLELRDAGALAVAYAQLFSMQNIHRLAELRRRHEAYYQQQAEKVASSVSLNQGDLISFDSLR